MKTDYKTVISFHGHSCPGLALGFRMAKAALRELKARRDLDEDIVAIVETDACGADAVQVVCGCTFGKGNLSLRMTGKNALTLFSRATGKGVRVYGDAFYKDDEFDDRLAELSALKKRTSAQKKELEKIRQLRIQNILKTPELAFLRITPAKVALPHKAVIYSSERCSKCHERVMAPCLVKKNGKLLCKDCAK